MTNLWLPYQQSKTNVWHHSNIAAGSLERQQITYLVHNNYTKLTKVITSAVFNEVGAIKAALALIFGVFIMITIFL